MLSTVLNKEIKLKGLFSKRDLLEFEVANVIEHILADPEDFVPGKSCGGSELRDIVRAGLNGELGERYRLMKNPYNEQSVKRFVDMILKF